LRAAERCTLEPVHEGFSSISSHVARVVLGLMLAIATACTQDDSSSVSPDMAGSAGAMAPISGAGGSASVGGGGAGGVAGMMMPTAGTAPSGGTGGVAGVEMMTGGMGDDSGAVAGMRSDGGSPVSDAGADVMATPSAGCSQGADRPEGGIVQVAQSHYFVFPESYDGTTPLPVLVGFHGCGGVNRGTSADDTEWLRLTNGSVFARDYVRFVPLSADAGGCWSYDTDIVRTKAAFDDLLESYCVDTSRVFATGHSSGAQLIVQILLSSHTMDAEHLRFRAVAPVAASDYGPMNGPIPVMYIQGMMDAERGNGDGHETVERFRAANGCSGGSVAYAEVSGCQSGSTSVNPGCVIYDGCMAPTVWCSHNDPQYGGTMHGVPCFAITAMHDFFDSAPSR
jgi:poly(3-hydroxybutyrate) depolymerase